MAVLAEHRPVVLPTHAASVQPAAALEHTLGEDDIDLLNRKLKVLIVEMKAEIAEARRLKDLGEGDGSPLEGKKGERTKK